MTLGISITIDTGRAIMAALQPLTGTRSVGFVKMRTKPGTLLAIPRNSYWSPVVDGQRMTSWLFKVVDGPNADKSWTVDDSGTSLVGMMSNLGGLKHNVDATTQFQPDIPIDDLVLTGADTPTANANFEGATAPADYCGVHDMAIYETFDGPAFTLDLHRSPINAFPGIMLAFQDFEPADGVAIAQNNQMAINAGDGKKFYKVTYSISVLTTKGEGDMSRRMEGLMIADVIMQLLNDKHSTDPGECLSNPGGMQVRTMIREDGPQPIYKKFYIYTVLVSAMVTLKRLDFRTYNPWLRAVMSIDKPQIPSLPDQGDFRIVDSVEIDMTPDSVDLAIDGTFVRATAANLWVPPKVDAVGELLSFLSGVRRTTNVTLGVMLEPPVSNDIGDAEDFTAWTASGGAVVVADVENDPQGALNADRIDFAADAASAVEFTGPIVPAGEPVVFYVFAKAVGTKFLSSMRLAAVDLGPTTHVSDDIQVGNVWSLYRFEFTAIAPGAVTLRLQNATDGAARSIMAWGAFYSNAARWGAEYPPLGVTKAKDALTFTALPVAGQQANLVTPQAVLTGRWRLRYLTPADVAPDVLGTAVGSPGRVLVSVGNGATELVTLTLVGTPGTGGALLTLATRGDGLVISIAGLEWVPGDELLFTIDASGTLVVEGSLNGDGEYPFARYVEDVLAADFMVIGDLSDGSLSPTPGRYVAVEVNV